MFSVLLSLYKKELPFYLQQSLNSLFSQTLLPDEIILVKDGPLTAELDAVVSEDDVGHLAVLVGHHDRDEAAAPVGNASLGTFGILEDVEAGRLACDLGFKLGFVQPGEGCFFLRFLLLLFAGT